jgi:hypothetical protein
MGLALALFLPALALSQAKPVPSKSNQANAAPDKSALEGTDLANPLSINVKPHLTSAQSTKRVESLSPGQTIKMEGAGDIQIYSEDGRIQITAQEGSVILFDGMVKMEAKPWLEDRPVLAREVKGQKPEKLAPQFRIHLGQAEVQVAPGQELRLASPLIISAVRGTKFSMSVKEDGSSKLSVLEGKVLSIARDGQIKMLEAGRAVELTAAKFTEYLRGLNIKIPDGVDWRSVDRQVLDRAVSQTFGDSLDFLSEVSGSVAEAKDNLASNFNDLSSKNVQSQDNAIPRKEMAIKP